MVSIRSNGSKGGDIFWALQHFNCFAVIRQLVVYYYYITKVALMI